MRVSKYISKWFPLFALPTLAAFILAFVIPFGMGLYLSFTKFQTVDNAQWVGLQNYVLAFTENSDFINALWFTVRFTVVSVVSVNICAYGLALLLTQALKGTNVFRAIFFLPNLIGGIVLGYVWQLLINGVLQKIASQDLTYNSAYGFWGLVIVVNWQMIGYMMIIYIAAIQNVPGEVQEAAGIDGASFFSKLIHVTIPMTASAVTICTFLTLANCLKLFDQNLALTGGAPQNQTEGLALNIFRTYYNIRGHQGVGQAKAVVFFVFVATIAFFQLRFTRSKEVDG
jgi:raffinose/stachyose/melibiose transport system permease protein